MKYWTQQEFLNRFSKILHFASSSFIKKAQNMCIAAQFGTKLSKVEQQGVPKHIFLALSMVGANWRQ